MVTVHAGKGLAQFFGGKLAYFALRTNAENLCLTLSIREGTSIPVNGYQI